MSKTRSKLAGGLALSAALGLGLGSLPAAQAARITYPRHGGAFVGASSQKSGTVALPVDLRASASGRVMTRFDIQWSATCQGVAGTGSYGGLSVTPGKKILAPGVFADANTFTRTFTDGSVGTFTIKVFGRFTTATRAAGTFNVHVAVVDPQGALSNTCDSGNVSWSATD